MIKEETRGAAAVLKLYKHCLEDAKFEEIWQNYLESTHTYDAQPITEDEKERYASRDEVREIA